MAQLDFRSFVWACVISGLVFAGVFLAMPFHQLLAGLAAFSAGYLSYRFRDVITAIPEALEQTHEGLARLYYGVKQANPYEHVIGMSGVLLFSVAWFFVPQFAQFMVDDITLRNHWPDFFVVFSKCILILIGEIMAFAYGVFIGKGLVDLGVRKVDHSFWLSTNDTRNHEYRQEGLTEKPLTYGNVLRWLGMGLGFVAAFLLWRMWWYGITAISKAIWCVLQFVGNLIRLIHSSWRVVAGLDGVIGGSLGCSYFYDQSGGVIGVAVLFLACGSIGAAIGPIHCRLAQFLLSLFPAREQACA